MTFVLKHPLLGSVTGVTTNKDVVQYLGIPYATLAHWLAAPQVKSNYGEAIDATKFGPTVLAPPLGCDIEFGLIQQSLEKPGAVPSMSDLEGLNLNITVPTALPGNLKDLPVLVFVHGGGFLFGGNWAPHYDLARIVSFSASIEKPIIGVSIKPNNDADSSSYRLGAPGFLDSKELGAAGSPPNRGLLDQQAAFQWLSNNIAGFGGDPKQLTAFGQSAGGSSVMHLLDLDSPEPMFQRAACLSGNKIAAALVPASVAQGAYATVLQALEIDSSLSAEDQVSSLIARPGEEVLSKVPMNVPLGPVVDDAALPCFGTMKSGYKFKLNVPLMIGSTSFDGGIYEVLGIFANADQESLVSDFASTFIRAVPVPQRENAEKLLGLYGLSSSNGLDSETARIKILQFGTDVKYFTSASAYAASWPAESWLYYFKEPNPWDGPHKGRATHVQDVAYVFLNYEHVMDDQQKKVAHGFAKDVIHFAYGESPWSEFRASREMRVYGESGRNEPVVNTLTGDTAGPSAEVRALWDEIGLDQMSKAWDAYFLRK
ncbi:Uncharacterized protein TPAR_00892 [Tolypocladium paradoxum]|uniref:Carboxylesterase type B domain-containing protein n=1 Tax=Tolypocladium paradoxum TaxID=94208 RepID=A0A2S4L8V3_9HYPO|nr:Uncharacterized protein TPAR_00892 [Tolypocladium paradoxum]